MNFYKVITCGLLACRMTVNTISAKIFLANQFTYFALCPLIKISIICFYRRVFTIPVFQHISFGLNCLIGSWGTAIFIACAVQCRPLRAYWDHSVPGKCFDGQLFIIVNQVFNVVMDFVILGLPVPMIWGLQRNWRDKLALNAVFAIGAFVCFASIYRIVTLFWMHPQDATYTIYQASLWTHIEPSVGLICSCLPIIRGLFPKFKIQSSRTRNSVPYYINTALSKTQFTMSSPKSPASDYMMMEDRLASGKGDQSPNYLGPMDITVRTDIEIAQDSVSTHSRG